MNICKFLWKQFICCAYATSYWGNGDQQQSQANQESSSENQDNRISGGNGSINLSTNRSDISGVTITTIDAGAVGGAFDFARDVATGAANTAAASSSANLAVTKSAMQAVQDAYAGSTEKIASAYTEGKAGEQKIMVAAGLLIVGVVAMKALGKGA